MRTGGPQPIFDEKSNASFPFAGSAAVLRDGHVLTLDDRLRNNVRRMIRLLDMVAVVTCGGAAWWLSHAGQSMRADAALFIAMVALLTINSLDAGRFYSDESMFVRRWRFLAVPLVMGGSVAVMPAILWVAGLPVPWSSEWLIRWALLGGGGMLALRATAIAFTQQVGRSPLFLRRVLVVGDGVRRRQVLTLLAGQNVDVREGRADEVDALLAGDRVDDVIVAVPWREEAKLSGVLARLRQHPVNVHLFPDAPAPIRSSRGVSVLQGVPMLRMGSRPLSGLRAFAKAAEDRLIGVLLLLLLAPLLLAVAVAIKLDSPGPVFFRQKRFGYNNQVFTVFKFRSMRIHAPSPDLKQATRNDPRVTRVGAFLRRSSLDELPQLFNVVNGTMSLVGPRPHAVEHQNYYQHLVDEYRCRHRMRPGITGWAQVNGYRGETNTVEMMSKRVEHDLFYIDNWSLLFDLWILLLTPFSCLRGKNAY